MTVWLTYLGWTALGMAVWSALLIGGLWWILGGKK